ncbi:MAG: YceI family protein [Solirubrobacteraceae bacterium]
MSITNSEHRFNKTITGSWHLDPERSSVEFRVGNFWGLATVQGHFGDYRGQLDLGAAPAIELTIDAASLDTGNTKRDEHLRSADFFDADNHPRVQFRSQSVQLQGDTLKLSGQLSARDRSIPVELDAKVRDVGGELEIEATTAAPHRELGMTWSPLRMISSRTKVLVKAHLVPDPSLAA